jgi:hypothetical protein
MSRSRKKYAIYKDKGFRKNGYWKTIRRIWKQEIHSGKDLSNPKAIINDYDYCDYIFALNNYRKVTSISQINPSSPYVKPRFFIQK